MKPGVFAVCCPSCGCRAIATSDASTCNFCEGSLAEAYQQRRDVLDARARLEVERRSLPRPPNAFEQ